MDKKAKKRMKAFGPLTSDELELVRAYRGLFDGRTAKGCIEVWHLNAVRMRPETLVHKEPPQGSSVGNSGALFYYDGVSLLPASVMDETPEVGHLLLGGLELSLKQALNGAGKARDELREKIGATYLNVVDTVEGVDPKTQVEQQLAKDRGEIH